MLVNLLKYGPLVILAAASEQPPNTNLKEVRPRRSEELLDVVETLALRLGDEEETEEEGEDGDPPENPEGPSLGQPGYLGWV